MKAVRMEEEPVWELGEQRYLPQIKRERENSTSDSPLTGLNTSRPDNHRLKGAKSAPAIPGGL